MKSLFFKLLFLSALVGCSSPPEFKGRSFSLSLSEREILQIRSEKRITDEELAHWDEIASELISKYPSDGLANRVFAYLYQAQLAFFQASEGTGSIGPISSHVLKLFFPKVKRDLSADPFSLELSGLIEKKIDARFKWEQSQIHAVTIHKCKDCWKGKRPYFGIKVPTMLPWNLSSPSEFRPSKPPPPEDVSFWQDQLAQVKLKMEQRTEAQTEIILYWDSKTNWRTVSEEYIKGMPLGKRIEIRAKVACALSDTFIALFDAKYAYLVRRPYQLDPQLKIVVPDPNHPSYPCAHCGLGAAVVTILEAYFPVNEAELERKLEECNLSRIQAGLHFPVDIEGGIEVGRNVGRSFIANDSSL